MWKLSSIEDAGAPRRRLALTCHRQFPPPWCFQVVCHFGVKVHTCTCSRHEARRTLCIIACAFSRINGRKSPDEIVDFGRLAGLSAFHCLPDLRCYIEPQCRENVITSVSVRALQFHCDLLPHKLFCHVPSLPTPRVTVRLTYSRYSHFGPKLAGGVALILTEKQASVLCMYPL